MVPTATLPHSRTSPTNATSTICAGSCRRPLNNVSLIAHHCCLCLPARVLRQALNSFGVCICARRFKDVLSHVLAGFTLNIYTISFNMHHHSPSWYILSSEATAHIRLDALAPAIVFTIIAFCMVLFRWFSRLVCRPGYIGLEDYLISIAVLLSICITGIIEFLLDSQHSNKGDRKASTLAIMLKLVFTQSLLYHLSIALVKTAFTLQYLRLFSLIRPITICCYILFGCIIGAAAWGIFGVIFLCKPIHTYWNLRVNGTCMDAETHFFSTSVIGIVLDWAIWILPIPVVGRLKLPRRQKWGLMCVFGLGGMVCVVSVLRLVLVWCYAHEGRVTKSGTFALIWSTLELNVAIICASLLVMKPLFARYVPAMVSDQPVSAREDARLWRAMTGLAQLDAAEDGKKDVEYEGCGRRDTVVESDIRQAGLLMIPRRAWDPKRGLRVKRRSSLF
ncbi:hypothetical protein HBH56_116160 [Parastagonospora nodorum]|uniref:Rhodopsin domain-containing protein n=1 Tax=Phaeosphaeria nodorum (strain SN15 / ATCC MYA-4574 / FGSC 10173) TaxID=321614 RepID=A0A7U2FGZ8_PHANO|nr:hypothetical protein HBH56_116160 [Parastagonospora nodorum]QRD05097.1 hypothetical protein JI435_110160 [Parastagonospora nodorum SN15]KAH3928965.1 hypothetical protein HBH54_133000 [Parastagonospora nodorum]KAH3965784.1 hypothetical protein HBH51_148470 [Parastagonospora nodorum]KAH3974102.1 hypothetical protein HBH52_138500 [Parastagonospora nodorum]